MKYTKEQINEARQKWLAVLRDPNSKKAYRVLEDYNEPSKRCCLGHACYALSANRTTLKTKQLVGYEGQFGYLPAVMGTQLNITADGAFKRAINCEPYPQTFMSLADINDGTHLEPAEIADIIEEQFEEANFMPFNNLTIG